jgi:hypothetical protein
MGAQAVQNSQLLMLHVSLSRQSAMVLTSFDHDGCCFPMGYDPPSINNRFLVFHMFTKASR